MKDNIDRRVYRCPICTLETPHEIIGHLGGMYGICCTHCRNGSLVWEDELHIYQLRWEDELRDIMQELST
ncbi:MAG: hypothetical protein ACOYEP_01165 [Limnochordia bacterium]|jgi:uncharacterized Zn finger protein